jgi:hypothetical protein
LSRSPPTADRGREGLRLPSLRAVRVVLPHTALRSVVSSSGSARPSIGCAHGEQPVLSEEGIYLPPLTPLTRAANIRSVQTDGSTQAHSRGSRVSHACLAVSGTDALGISLPSDLVFTDQPSCPPSLGAALLSALLVRSRSTLGRGGPPARASLGPAPPPRQPLVIQLRTCTTTRALTPANGHLRRQVSPLTSPHLPVVPPPTT